MWAGIAGVHVVNVVGGNHLEIKLLRELEQAGDDFELLGDAVVLDFDEIVFPAENVDKPGAGFTGLFLAVVEKMLGNELGETTGEAD